MKRSLEIIHNQKAVLTNADGSTTTYICSVEQAAAYLRTKTDDGNSSQVFDSRGTAVVVDSRSEQSFERDLRRHLGFRSVKYV